MNTALAAYFKLELEALGYPTGDIRFSLGYCQGDGVAFYGQVSKAGIERLIARLMPPPRCDLPADASLSDRILGEHRARLATRQYMQRLQALLPRIELTLTRRGNYYDHAETIGVEMTLGELDYSEVNLDPVEGSPRAWCKEFEQLLREDVRAVSHRLCDAGYGLIESTPYEPVELRSIDTARLRVRVLAVKDEDIGLSGDEEYDRADLTGLAERRLCHCGIQVEIIDLEDQATVDRETLWSVTLQGPRPTWSGPHVRAIARDLLAELRGRVSTRIKRLALAAGVELEDI